MSVSQADLRRKQPGMWWFLAVALSLMPSWSTFPATWNDQRSYGIAIAVFCIWQAWLRRNSLVLRHRINMASAAALVATMVLWLVSYVAGIRVGHQFFAIAALFAWAGAIYAEESLKDLVPILAISLIALPFWEVFLGPLQAMTIVVNHVLVRLFAIPAELTGAQIKFQFGTIEVAQSCAGLSYFMSALTIGVIYSYLFIEDNRKRVLAIAMALGLAVVSNWIRVFGLIVIGYRSKMTSSLMSEHALYGWVIFAAVISLFFFAARPLEAPATTPTGLPSHTAGPSPLEPSSSGHTAYRFLGVSAIVLIPVSLLLVSSLVTPVYSLPATITGVSIPPGVVLSPNASRGSALWRPAFVGGQHNESLSLTIATKEERSPIAVQIDRIGFDGVAQGGELIGGANAIAAVDNIIDAREVGPLDSRLRIVNQAVLRTPTGGRLVWYWYRVAGVETASALRAKVLEVLNWVTRREPSQVVAVSAGCAKSDCMEALAAVHLVVTGRTIDAR